MGIKVKAVERNVSFDKNNKKWAYVMQANLYNRLDDDKVIAEAAIRSGLPKAVINAGWTAIGEVIKVWTTEGHSVAIPGLGSLRFGINSKAISDVNKVSSELITRRYIIFTPNVEIKQELNSTSINITCYDRTGKVVKQVTSTDDPDKDPEGGNTPTTPEGGGSGNTGAGGSGEGGGSQSGGGDLDL